MDPTSRSSPRRLQGPRPPRLTVNKESVKIRKAPPHPAPPPHASTSSDPPSHASDARRRPVIIYDAYPKVIHTKPSDFMSLVQRLTGQNSDAGPSAISPAASLATIEKSVTPSASDASPQIIHTKPSEFMAPDAWPAGPGPGVIGQVPPGILSPRPSSLLPVPPGLFSPLQFDPSHLTILNELSPVFKGLAGNSNFAGSELKVVEKDSSKQFSEGGSLVFGREDDKNKIFELILGDNYSNRNPNFVCVVGDRGTGRTTILDLVYNDARVLNAFDSRRFICMPEEFDDKELMRVVIQSLSRVPCNITDLEILKEIVTEELRDNKVLLLLDNFENKTQKCWDLLSMLLNICAEGSSIVVTTTRKIVAEVRGPIHFYYMNHLSDKWCWFIFKHGVFCCQNPNANADLLDIGKQLVAKCRNIVLCIRVISSLVRHSVTIDWWRAVLDSDFWEVDEVEGDILQALRVCYEFLPPNLKKCFRYCSLFPKEYVFLKQHLVHMWLSLDFIEPCESKELENIGLEYFDELLSRSFLQPSPIHDTKEEKFMMPGLVHDLAQQLCKNEYFRSGGYVQQAPGNACHILLVPREFQSVSLKHLTTGVHDLQTFMVLNPSTYLHECISPSILNLVELDDLFERYSNLTLLKLDNTDIEELPRAIMLLSNLRFLGLSNTNIKRIPMEVSNLVRLQTLEAKDCHCLEELPETIEALTNLHNLDVSKEVGYVIMPRGIGKLTSIRRLATFNVGMDPQMHCGIEELKHMVHLKGCLQISGLVNVRSEINAKAADIGSKEKIETLSLHWSDGKTILEGEEGAEIAEEVLQNLHPNDNLKEVVIRDYLGNAFPRWIESSYFSRLVSVIFDHCYNCERLPDLGGLPLLRFLSIQKMYSVQTMNLSNSDFIPENSIRYPSLEQLNIWEMYELEDWVEIRNQDFPCIRTLSINRCSILRNIPKFSSLVDLLIYSCTQFLESMDLPSLQSLQIEGLQKTKFVRLPKTLVRLKKLEIRYCPELLSIEGLSELNYLEMNIKVVRCPKFDMQGCLNMKRERKTSVLAQGNKVALSEGLEFSSYGLPYLEQDHQNTSKKRKFLAYLLHTFCKIQVPLKINHSYYCVENC